MTICQECCQMKSKDNCCRCTIPKVIGVMYIEQVEGCIYWCETGNRCKRKQVNNLFLCGLHDLTNNEIIYIEEEYTAGVFSN